MKRRAWRACAGLVASTWLAGCAGLIGSHDVRLDEAQIEALLDRQFPMERKMLSVIDLEVAHPQIHLLPDANRIGTELDVTALDRVFGASAHGHVNLDYALRFDPADHSIRMTQVHVRELVLDSGANSLHGIAQRLGTLAAENALENLPLYKMKPAQAEEMDRLNLVASPIRVTAQGLQMTISPRSN